MNTVIINAICFLLFPCIVLWKAEYAKQGWNDGVLTKDDSAALRGIAAVFVMFAHFLIYLNENGMGKIGPAKLYEWCGGLGVCVFFFASGYGLEIAYQKKKVDYKYIKSRFISIVPAFLILRLVFAVCLAVWKQGWVYFLLYLFNLKEPMWFISEIILIYILYFIAMKISRKNSIILMTLFLFGMSMSFYFLNFDARWYNANLVFVVGMLIAKYRIEFLSFMQKVYWLKLIFCILLFGATAVGFTFFKGEVWANGLKLLAGALFSILFVCVFMKLRIHSRSLLFLGKNSLQLYIIHLSVLDVFEAWHVDWRLLLQFIMGLAISTLLTIIYALSEAYLKKLQTS